MADEDYWDPFGDIEADVDTSTAATAGVTDEEPVEGDGKIVLTAKNIDEILDKTMETLAAMRPLPWENFDEQAEPDLGLHTPTCTREDWKHKDVELVYGKGIAYIVFNRPKSNNSVCDSLLDGFNDAVAALHKSPDVRVVVLCARGTMFCSGDDLKWRQVVNKRLKGEVVADDGCTENGKKVEMKAPSEDVVKNIAALKDRAREMEVYDDDNQMALLPNSKALWNLSCLPMLVVGVINGSVIGSGMGYVCACDVVISLESAQFMLNEVKNGVCSSVTHFVLSKGGNKAATLMMMGETLTAEEAEATKFVQYVVKSKDAAQKKLEEICAIVQTLAPTSVIQAKRFTFGCTGRLVTNSLVYWSLKNWNQAIRSKDFKESVAAEWAKSDVKPITPPPWN